MKSTRSRRWQVVALAVVALLVLGEAGARLVENKLPPRTGTEQEAYIKSEQLDRMATAGLSPDIAFVGASGVDAGFDPTVFNTVSDRFDRSYNAALRGSPLSVLERWATQVVVPRADPTLVVVGLEPSELSVTDGREAAALAEAGQAYDRAIDEVDPGPLKSLEQELEDHSVLVRERDQLRSPSTLFGALRRLVTGDPVETRDENSREFIAANVDGNGANLQYRQPPDEVFPDRVMAERLERLGDTGVNVTSLRRFLVSLKQSGTEVAVVLMPADYDTLEPLGLSPDRFQEATDQARELADQLDVPLLDLSRAGYGPELFHDKLHLAAPGAHRFSAEVARWLDGRCAEGALAC